MTVAVLARRPAAMNDIFRSRGKTCVAEHEARRLLPMMLSNDRVRHASMSFARRSCRTAAVATSGTLWRQHAVAGIRRSLISRAIAPVSAIDQR